MALAAGTRLGPYEIGSSIGAGGMGEVYKARDTRLDRTVAVKVLPAELAADRERRARFEREARAIAALSHPYICVVYDVGRDGEVDYLVMEHLEGETLAACLERAKGPLPLDQVLRFAGEIADALDKAHRAGVVHRDLKPANIMLTKSGVKLLDFGLAKLRGVAAPIAMTTIEGATTPGVPATATGTTSGRSTTWRRSRWKGATRMRDRGAAVRGHVGGQFDRRNLERHAAADVGAAAADAGGAGPSGRTVSRQGSGRALAERRRHQTRAGLDRANAASGNNRSREGVAIARHVCEPCSVGVGRRSQRDCCLRPIQRSEIGVPGSAR
jgi:Protein kinase domain